MSEELATEEEFLRWSLAAAAALRCTFHEETRGELSRFSVILPDTRIVSSSLYEPRRAALVRVCRAALPYWRRWIKEEREAARLSPALTNIPF